MKGYNIARIFLIILLAAFFIPGCASMKLKDGELAIGANTSATLEEGTIPTIKNKF